METLDQPIAEQQHLVTPQAARHLRSTSPWMVFVGVMFLLSGVFMSLSSIALFVQASNFSSIGKEGFFILIGVFYLLGGGLFMAGGFMAISSGGKLGTFGKFPNAVSLEEFASKQKVFWILMGVFWIFSIISMIGIIIMAGRMASVLGGPLR